MKNIRRKYILLICLIAIVAIGIVFLNQLSIDNIHQEIAKNNNYSVETPMPETYDSLCRIENQNEIYFPNKKVEYAKMTK